jgi:hypothetical protein
MLQDIFDLNFFARRERMKGAEYLRYGGLGLAFIGLVVLYVFEFPYFHNTFAASILVFYSLIIGLIVGLVLAYFFGGSAKDLTETIQIYVFFVAMAMIFMPLFGSLSNRLLDFNPLELREVEFVEEVPFYSSRYGVLEGEEIKPSGYYSFFYHEARLERIKCNKPLFFESKRGDNVEVFVKRGFWGFEYMPLYQPIRENTNEILQ